jgi:hypothetical protein
MCDQIKKLHRSTFWKPTKGCVTLCGLAIYIKKYLKAKEELWKLKCFTMQKYNPLKRNQIPSRYYNFITNLKFQHKPKYHIFKNPHIKIDPKSLKLLHSIMNLNTISLPTKTRPTKPRATFHHTKLPNDCAKSFWRGSCFLVHHAPRAVHSSHLTGQRVPDGVSDDIWSSFLMRGSSSSSLSSLLLDANPTLDVVPDTSFVLVVVAAVRC